MQRIPRDQARKYAFNWWDEPLLRVKPGESFEIETDDAITSYFKSPDDLAIPARRPGFDRVPPLANPIGGPSGSRAPSAGMAEPVLEVRPLHSIHSSLLRTG